ncbi:MAG: ketol-acid reductoisomerase [Thermoguttaceae bacterium]
MSATIHRDANADLAQLAGKTIAVLGYGSQGHAHALNLRDSGCSVLVAQRRGSANYDRALDDGFQPLDVAEAAGRAQVIAILLPDEAQPDVFRREIRPNVAPGTLLVFAHGFNVRYGQIDPPPDVSMALVAPLGPGALVRTQYVRGSGVPCLVAVAENETPLGTASPTFRRALAYAKALGATRVGAIETTFAEETETDLFAEQAITCGGLTALMQASFQTLVDAGYQPEIAYFVCVHEVRQIVDLVCQGGLSHMRKLISNTAEYGDYTRGPRLVTRETKAELQHILAEIRDGRFAHEWIAENQTGAKSFETLRRQLQSTPMEEVGRRVRELLQGND